MDLANLVKALVDRDALTARQWVTDSARAQFDWNKAELPDNLDEIGRAVAAAVVELLAERVGQQPPEWTSAIPSLAVPLFLVRAAETMPRLRRVCEEEGPWPLRRRRILAPPEFLTVA